MDPDAAKANAPPVEERGVGSADLGQAQRTEYNSNGEVSDRPFIYLWRRALFESDLKSTAKLVLLALGEHANKNGSSCFPSIKTVAKFASLNEKTARRQLAACKRAGWFGRESAGTRQGWRRYGYELYLPVEGAGGKSARARLKMVRTLGAGEGTQPARQTETCGLSDPMVRTLDAGRAGTESTDLSINYPRNSYIQRERKEGISPLENTLTMLARQLELEAITPEEYERDVAAAHARHQGIASPSSTTTRSQHA